MPSYVDPQLVLVALALIVAGIFGAIGSDLWTLAKHLLRRAASRLAHPRR